MKVKTKISALIIVDVQNDFCPGGTLAVPHGDEVVLVINKVMPRFEKRYFTKDWHPENHCSFKKNGGQWPIHCVAETHGARLRDDLSFYGEDAVILKARNPNKEAYSGFDGTALEELLKEANITAVYVCGLATDYCVKATALDAKKLGLQTYVILDACRGVNVKSGDCAMAVKEMKKAGVEIITSRELY